MNDQDTEDDRYCVIIVGTIMSGHHHHDYRGNSYLCDN